MPIWGYLLLALAVAASIGEGVHYTSEHWETAAGVRKGEDNKQKLWDAANEKARQEEAARQAAAELTARTAAQELAAAQQKAGDYYGKWQQARKAARNAELASCGPAPTAAPNAPTGDPGKPEPRFSLKFIGLWDGAWTDGSGKPLWPDDLQRGGAEAGGETVTAEEVLDNHGANAKACSENARRLDNLTAKIKRLRDGWK